jgi:sarcosine oxidase subunit beta
LSTLKLMRQWGGTVDTSPDNSPIIGPGPVEGLFLDCGWGTGGFKAIPAGGTVTAHLLATGRHHPLSEPFDLRRFARGELVDEGHAGVAH